MGVVRLSIFEFREMLAEADKWAQFKKALETEGITKIVLTSPGEEGDGEGDPAGEWEPPSAKEIRKEWGTRQSLKRGSKYFRTHKEAREWMQKESARRARRGEQFTTLDAPRIMVGGKGKQKISVRESTLVKWGANKGERAGVTVTRNRGETLEVIKRVATRSGIEGIRNLEIIEKGRRLGGKVVDKGFREFAKEYNKNLDELRRLSKGSIGFGDIKIPGDYSKKARVTLRGMQLMGAGKKRGRPKGKKAHFIDEAHDIFTTKRRKKKHEDFYKSVKDY